MRVLLALALVVLVAPVTLGAPTVGGALNGAGVVTDYYIHTGGEYVEGGAFEATFGCMGCYVRFTVQSGTFDLVQDGALVALGPGDYQIAGFAGVIGITAQGSHAFFFEVHGSGDVARWAP